MSRIKRARCGCGRLVHSNYGFYCKVCSGIKTRYRVPQTRLLKVDAEMAEWIAKLDQSRDVSYPLAAAAWSVALKEAIRRINKIVEADKLRGTGQTGRFYWVKEERW